MQTDSADNFFQTDREIEIASAREAKKNAVRAANTRALSIATMRSKVLCMRFFGNVAFVGESGHVARKVDPSSGKVLLTFKGHKGPVTCLELMFDQRTGEDQFLFTGSWDKSIFKFDSKNGDLLQKFTGHADFIKCITLVPTVVNSKLAYHLLSGSSDGTIKKWDSDSGKLHQTWKGHTRPVESLVLAESEDGTAKNLQVYSASSDTTIRKWDVATGNVTQVLNGHLTSVYGIILTDGELWSVSADKTAKRWNLENSVPDSSFEHPDFVKCIHVYGSYVLTGCRDENIRVFDLTTEKCINVVEGHFGEVTSLQVVGDRLWSASLDCTIRSWNLADILMQRPATVEVQDLSTSMEVDADVSAASAAETSGTKKADATEMALTEEEERELAELMGDD
ncbi:hypothetical protein HDU77_001434 [Chytriomyces hyalinus]|nr:hypothetical protein HDU77_001434 [Chytriomyces hyalinus]